MAGNLTTCVSFLYFSVLSSLLNTETSLFKYIHNQNHICAVPKKLCLALKGQLFEKRAPCQPWESAFGLSKGLMLNFFIFFVSVNFEMSDSKNRTQFYFVFTNMCKKEGYTHSPEYTTWIKKIFILKFSVQKTFASFFAGYKIYLFILK